MSRPSRSRAIAIANPHLSREQLAAARKRERKAEEMRQSQLARQDEAVPTARKETGTFRGGEPWHYAPRQKQAVFCKGFPIPTGSSTRRAIHGMSENNAQRAILQTALDEVGGNIESLPVDQIAAALALTDEQQRKVRREMRGRAK